VFLSLSLPHYGSSGRNPNPPRLSLLRQLPVLLLGALPLLLEEDTGGGSR